VSYNPDNEQPAIPPYPIPAEDRPVQQGRSIPPAPTFTPTGCLSMIILATLTFTLGWFGSSFVNGPPQSARPYASDVWQAWSDIDQYYVDKHAINHQKMAYAMISAMVDTLGDTGHSRFLTPDEVKAFNQQLSNSSFVGIGVLLQEQQINNTNVISIEYTLPNSPANKVGILPGDQIATVDGQDVSGKTIDQVRPLLAGAKGTTVTVTVRRPSDTKLHTFTITRNDIVSPLVVDTYFSDLQVGYVQLTSFSKDASKQLKDTLSKLKDQGMKGIILDLRGNPGGYVDEALGVASSFLPSGATVVYEKDSSGALTPQKVGSDGLHLTMPMIVLVDNGTASAAEIITGALQDNRPQDVTVVGQRTFGTDTVLETFDLPDGSQMVLGVQQFLTPNKRQFKPGTGLEPNVSVALPDGSFPLSPLVLQELNLTEADVLAGKTFSNDTQLVKAIDLIKTKLGVGAGASSR
jgi:carboxyl-terminal processing protease